jgi:hypothetical protein
LPCAWRGLTTREAWIDHLSCALGYLTIARLVAVGVLPLTGAVLALTRENPRALFGLTVVLEASSLRVRAQAILAERGWRSGADDASTLDETRPS